MTDLAEPPAPMDATDQTGPSWDERRLCPDGACVGVLDGAGRCPVCGRVDRTAPRPAARSPQLGAAGDGRADEGTDEGTDEETDEETDADPQALARATAAPAAEADQPDGDWSTRQLCSDGACIGVVVHGRCNTCGKAPAP